MKVTLIAKTALDCTVDGRMPGVDYLPIDDPVTRTAADYVAEFAGRACYQSWDRPNPNTADNKSYLANILRQNHESVLEHASATFYVEGVSRSLLAEITRHRHLSFSVLSQRYVDASKMGTVYPPALQGAPIIDSAILEAREKYDTLVSQLTETGLSRKQAREAARAVLPNATETKFVVTGNMRAWRDVIRKRLSPAADAEIYIFAWELLCKLKEIAPSTFQDF